MSIKEKVLGRDHFVVIASVVVIDNVGYHRASLWLQVGKEVGETYEIIFCIIKFPHFT